jgi:YD repeat-containing protein
VGSYARPAPRVIPDSARATIRDPKGSTTRIAFDRWGLPARVEDHEGKASSWERNEAGQVIRSTDARGGTGTYVWSGPDLILIGEPAYGSHTEIHYEGHKPKAVFHGDVLQVTNFYGPTALLDSTRMDTSVTRYTYDARGRMLSVRDPEGHRSSVSYQSSGMQNTASATAMRGNETRTTTYAYDALGRVERVSDPAGRVVRTAYDLLNRVIRVTGPDSTVVRYGYNDPARTYTLTDPKGQTYSTVSNALGWVESQTDPRGKVERSRTTNTAT